MARTEAAKAIHSLDCQFGIIHVTSDMGKNLGTLAMGVSRTYTRSPTFAFFRPRLQIALQSSYDCCDWNMRSAYRQHRTSRGSWYIRRQDWSAQCNRLQSHPGPSQSRFSSPYRTKRLFSNSKSMVQRGIFYPYLRTALLHVELIL